jgi:hypothetical protein
MNPTQHEKLSNQPNFLRNYADLPDRDAKAFSSHTIQTELTQNHENKVSFKDINELKDLELQTTPNTTKIQKHIVVAMAKKHITQSKICKGIQTTQDLFRKTPITQKLQQSSQQ